ncbi:hypothetical protein BDM02DRAFT_3117770 [Thelephora ganbajun]|uniref:Uncharacterized protein n=1 Tax=Thelephora ganbajun TaxID=370292 RepID=A0ACB6ZC40_THEGA|nr:hypothetical protein BDM02DRAFT_3117770 [Thelephora ganbajun]
MVRHRTATNVERTLNQILRIKGSETPDYPYYKDGIRESTHHSLSTYPHYAGVRRLLRAKLGQENT